MRRRRDKTQKSQTHFHLIKEGTLFQQTSTQQQEQLRTGSAASRLPAVVLDGRFNNSCTIYLRLVMTLISFGGEEENQLTFFSLFLLLFQGDKALCA